MVHFLWLIFCVAGCTMHSVFRNVSENYQDDLFRNKQQQLIFVVKSSFSANWQLLNPNVSLVDFCCHIMILRKFATSEHECGINWFLLSRHHSAQIRNNWTFRFVHWEIHLLTEKFIRPMRNSFVRWGKSFILWEIYLSTERFIRSLRNSFVYWENHSSTKKFIRPLRISFVH